MKSMHTASFPPALLPRRALVGLLALAYAAAAAGQLVIRKTGEYDVHVEASNGDGGRVSAQLRQLLAASGSVKPAAAPENAYLVRTNVGGPAISGAVFDPAGNGLLARSYTSPDGDTNIRRFAADVLVAITGESPLPGGVIVFSGGSGRAREIFAVQPDGTNLRQLTSDRSLAVSPAISPDGAQLAFTSYASGYPDVHLLDLRSGARKRIFSSPGTNTGAAFDPAGKKLALSMSFTGNPELYVGGLGGGARRLTRSPGVESSPTWSPDGKRIAYVHSHDGSPQVMIIGSGGGAPVPVRAGHAWCTEPSWSPDGAKLAMTVRSGGLAIAVHELAAGTTRILGPGEDPAWGPDSRHLAAVQGGTLLVIDSSSGRRLPVVNGRNAKEPSWTR
jgi:TolB protein